MYGQSMAVIQHPAGKGNPWRLASWRSALMKSRQMRYQGQRARSLSPAIVCSYWLAASAWASFLSAGFS